MSRGARAAWAFEPGERVFEHDGASYRLRSNQIRLWDPAHGSLPGRAPPLEGVADFDIVRQPG